MYCEVPTFSSYKSLVKKQFYDGLTDIFGANIPVIGWQQYLLMTFVSISLIVKSRSTVRTSAPLAFSQSALVCFYYLHHPIKPIL